MDHVENIVVGGGVVGLAICRELNKAGRESILLEVNLEQRTWSEMVR